MPPNVPAAPILRPTYSEWQDFASYVRKITPEIAPFGGCQVIPPPEWAHHQRAGDAARQARDLLKEKKTTQIAPLRQHVSGRDGKFQAVMEWMDKQDLQQFVSDAAESSDGLSPEELDARFWRFAAARPSPLYGADSSEAGSLFAPSLTEWNLGALPGGVHHDLTQELDMTIPGLNQSMLYFGSWRSFFAMHTEDCELQGASYLHFGAPKRWYIVPPSHADRVRSLAAACFPELEQSCPSFLRHKTTLLSPAVLKASNIPCFSALQTEGTFVVVLSSAFHFGYNQGPNCAEAVNFGLTEWLPAACRARPCTCDGNQTPHIDVPLLMRRVKARNPVEAAEWWCFCCACGETCTSFDDEEEAPEGEQFECSTCGNWGHLACYDEYARAATAGSVPEVLNCIQCTDSWRGGEFADEAWEFSCACGRNEGASHLSAATGDAPTGRMFQCSLCAVWSHTECYDDYRGLDDDALPDLMRCNRCRAGSSSDTPRRRKRHCERHATPSKTRREAKIR